MILQQIDLLRKEIRNRVIDAFAAAKIHDGNDINIIIFAERASAAVALFEDANILKEMQSDRPNKSIGKKNNQNMLCKVADFGNSVLSLLSREQDVVDIFKEIQESRQGKELGGFFRTLPANATPLEYANHVFGIKLPWPRKLTPYGDELDFTKIVFDKVYR